MLAGTLLIAAATTPAVRGQTTDLPWTVPAPGAPVIPRPLPTGDNDELPAPPAIKPGAARLSFEDASSVPPGAAKGSVEEKVSQELEPKEKEPKQKTEEK